MMKTQYHVYVSPKGNIFMREIASALAASVSDLGYETIFPAAGLPEHAPNRVNLVVAPHEFFLLESHRSKDELRWAVEASVIVGVEQPGTPWFELSSSYARAAKYVLDISNYAVDELTARGVEAELLQFGYHRSWDRWGGDTSRPRPTDVLFLGAITPRREEVLSAVGPMIWEFKSDVRLFEYDQPMVVPQGRFVAGDDKRDLLASSRVLLNIHRSDIPYFEWIRVLESIINGSLVITELAMDYGPLVPGEHFIAAPAGSLGAQTLSLLCDESLRAHMATAAYEFVRTKLDLSKVMEPICERLNQASSRARSARRGMSPIPGALSTTGESPSPHPALTATLTVEREARIRIKDLLESETNLVRKVEALEAQLIYGDPNHLEIKTTPAWAQFQPEVSVIIPCYNYGRFVQNAMESVVTNKDLRVELVVVDDHSSDNSTTVVTKFMQEKPWFPAILLARAANAGLGAARDLGVRYTRSDRVFMLDADNEIFPSCLSKLTNALDTDADAAFSYGIICKVGVPGLLSQFPWNVPRLVRGNYIDAMVLLRKKVWEEVGGYDASLSGWEDYELWLRIADHGYKGAFVPECVASYRVHGESLLQTVNVDVTALMADFRNRYPLLPWTD